MPHLQRLVCKTRVRSTESQADLGDLCPAYGSLLGPGGDLGEIG